MYGNSLFSKVSHIYRKKYDNNQNGKKASLKKHPELKNIQSSLWENQNFFFMGFGEHLDQEVPNNSGGLSV